MGKVTEPDFRENPQAQIWAKQTQFLILNEDFGHFVEFESFFADFAYYNRQAWYLTISSGESDENFRPN